jgi:hypothetical protein
LPDWPGPSLSNQFAAFCFVLATIGRYVIDTGVLEKKSATKAWQIGDLEVATMRAEPARGGVPRHTSAVTVPFMVHVENVTDAPDERARLVLVASFTGAPPALSNTSTPISIGDVEVLVQAKYVETLKFCMTPGMEKSTFVAWPPKVGVGVSTSPASAPAAKFKRRAAMRVSECAVRTMVGFSFE